MLQDGVLVGYGVYEGVNKVVVEHLRSRGELRALRVIADVADELGQAADRHEGEPGALDVRAEAAAGDERDVVAAPGEPTGELQQRRHLAGEWRSRDDDLGRGGPSLSGITCSSQGIK